MSLVTSGFTPPAHKFWLKNLWPQYVYKKQTVKSKARQVYRMKILASCRKVTNQCTVLSVVLFSLQGDTETPILDSILSNKLWQMTRANARATVMSISSAVWFNSPVRSTNEPLWARDFALFECGVPINVVNKDFAPWPRTTQLAANYRQLPKTYVIHQVNEHLKPVFNGMISALRLSPYPSGKGPRPLLGNYWRTEELSPKPHIP